MGRPISKKRLQDIYEFLLVYKQQNDGLSPTFREIMDACSIPSTSVVQYYLNDLQAKGLIEYAGKQRIKVVGGQYIAPIRMPEL